MLSTTVSETPNELQIFTNSDLGIELGAILYKDKPVFFAVEVAKALGYSDPYDALKIHCKSLIKLNSGESPELGFGFKPKGIILLPEADLYRLILRSKLPSAERIQDWVCEDVLPAILQTGSYQLPKQPVPQSFSEALMLAAQLAKDNELLADQRDEAIRTKAQISDKREATACQRNSVYQRIANRAIREREEMTARFGASKEWASQQAMWRATGKMFGWNALNAWLDQHDIHDPLTDCYPTGFNPEQNSREVIYPRQAWFEVYGVDIAEIF